MDVEHASRRVPSVGSAVTRALSARPSCVPIPRTQIKPMDSAPADPAFMAASVCPCGGHHEWSVSKDNDFWAGISAGALCDDNTRLAPLTHLT